MKITAISIFPEYFSPLELSLIGKARSQSLIDFKSINLRDFTTDNHHSVDDTPYGGGAGMVMMAVSIFDAHVSNLAMSCD